MTELGFTTDQYLVTIEVPDSADPRDLPSPDLLQRTIYHAVPCLTEGLASVEVTDVGDSMQEAFANLRQAVAHVQAVRTTLYHAGLGGADPDPALTSLDAALADMDQAKRFLTGQEVPA